MVPLGYWQYSFTLPYIFGIAILIITALSFVKDDETPEGEIIKDVT